MGVPPGPPTAWALAALELLQEAGLDWVTSARPTARSGWPGCSRSAGSRWRRAGARRSCRGDRTTPRPTCGGSPPRASWCGTCRGAASCAPRWARGRATRTSSGSAAGRLAFLRHHDDRQHGGRERGRQPDASAARRRPRRRRRCRRGALRRTGWRRRSRARSRSSRRPRRRASTARPGRAWPQSTTGVEAARSLIATCRSRSPASPAGCGGRTARGSGRAARSRRSAARARRCRRRGRSPRRPRRRPPRRAA